MYVIDSLFISQDYDNRDSEYCVWNDSFKIA